MYIVRDRLIGRPYKQYTRLVKGRIRSAHRKLQPMRTKPYSSIPSTDKDKLFLQRMEQGKLIIGTYGDVYSTVTNRFIGFINNDGYWAVVLKVENKIKQICVHRLVWLFNYGKIPKGFVVNHIDGDKFNNTIENLETCTPSNSKHAFKHSLTNPSESTRGIKNKKAKLNNAVVKQIRKMYQTGMYSYSTLATEFNVKKATIQKVVNRSSWKHVA